MVPNYQHCPNKHTPKKGKKKKIELLSVVKSRKEAYLIWKDSHIPIKNDRNLARAYRDGDRKAKALPKLKLAKDARKKAFLVDVSTKQEQREDTGPSLNRAGKQDTRNADEAEVLNTSFLLPLPVYTTESSSYNKAGVDLSAVALSKGSAYLNQWPGVNPFQCASRSGLT